MITGWSWIRGMGWQGGGCHGPAGLGHPVACQEDLQGGAEHTGRFMHFSTLEIAVSLYSKKRNQNN